MADYINLRAVVLDILSEVFENGQYSHMVINQALSKFQYLEKNERSFIMRVAAGTIENRIYLAYVVDSFSNTPTKKMKPVIRNIILMSVYQILFMDQVPDSAVCNEAVKLAVKRKFNGLKGFVNGLLRTIARQKDSIEVESAKETEKLSITYSVPEWIVDKWTRDYDIGTVEKILKAFLKEKKTYIRCRQGKSIEVKKSLEECNITVTEAPYVADALCVSGYNYLGVVPAFLQGLFQVQDISSMLAGIVAAPLKNQYIIDVCAAPGGKATHIAELLEETGHVEARDVSDMKISMVESNIDRLGLNNISVKVWDATCHDVASEEKADILICDLPCSGLGVIGRKPDIKYRMTQSQTEELVSLQREILTNVWNYVKPGGRLVFSTCTINRDENEDNVKWILENLPFEEEDITMRLPNELREGMISKGYIQLLPGVHGTDGFFISSFIRKE